MTALNARIGEALSALDDRPSPRLVIDLRQNGGGDNRLNWPLLEGLISRPRVSAIRCSGGDHTRARSALHFERVQPGRGRRHRMACRGTLVARDASNVARGLPPSGNASVTRHLSAFDAMGALSQSGAPWPRCHSR